MTTSHPASTRKVISIASASFGALPHSHPVLALVRGRRVMNLAELAEFICADRMLNDLVIQTACGESGWPKLSVEEAIVLLGGEALCSLLSAPQGHRSFAKRLPGPLHSNRIPLQTPQEEPE